MPVKQHPPSRARRPAPAFLVLAAVLAPVAASAAGRTPAPPPAPPRGATAWTAAESEPANCSQSRRKLWQAGEGWVVKTVTVCR